MKSFFEQKGQGLLETTVAVGVVVTALVGSITLVAFSLRSTTSTINRLIAQNLAWEAIEVAVNIRDSNYLAGDPFDTVLTGADTTAIFTFDETSNIWSINFTPNSLADASTVLYREGGLYRQAITTPSGTPTQFRRLVQLDNSSPEQIVITSTVQWTEGTNTFEVEAFRTLYDWR